MQIVNYVGEGILKKKVVTEISATDYAQLVADISAKLIAQFTSLYDKKMLQLSEEQGSIGERLTHAQQALECFVWNNATPTKQATMVTPMLDALIEARGLGETKQQLVDAILTNVTEFSQQSAGLYAEKLANEAGIDIPEYIPTEYNLTLIVDVDGADFDNVNQVTDEALNQVVMPAGGVLDLSTIPWLSDVVGVKTIGGVADSLSVVDSNSVTTATLIFSDHSVMINGTVIADGLPVSLPMVVYR